MENSNVYASPKCQKIQDFLSPGGSKKYQSGGNFERLQTSDGTSQKRKTVSCRHGDFQFPDWGGTTGHHRPSNERSQAHSATPGRADFAFHTDGVKWFWQSCSEVTKGNDPVPFTIVCRSEAALADAPHTFWPQQCCRVDCKKLASASRASRSAGWSPTIFLSRVIAASELPLECSATA